MGRMMSRIVFAIFRAGENIAAGVVLAIMAYYIHLRSKASPPDNAINALNTKYIYSISLAAASVLIALLLFSPSNYTFRHFPLDFFMSVAWFVAFAFLLLDFQGKDDCDPSTRQFAELALGGSCNNARAAFGFAFLSGCFWAVTFIVGLWVVTRERKLKRRTSTTITTAGG